MKKILSLSLLFTTFIMNSQVLLNENFNSLTIGNLNTNIDGSAAGQGGWFTTATNGAAPTTTNNASVANFQIVSNGNNSSQGFLLQTPNGDKGTRKMWQNGFPALWASRDVGKDIIEVEYDLFTDPSNGNIANVDVWMQGNNGGNIVYPVGMRYNPAIRSLRGLIYKNEGGFISQTSITFNLSNSYELNTWIRIGFSYNITTGEAIWKGPNGILSTGPAYNSTNWIANSNPTELSINVTVPTTGIINNTTSDVIFDNLIVRSVATSTLSVDNVQSVVKRMSLFPNPTTNNINIHSNENIKSIKIMDVNGRVIINQNTSNSNTINIDVSNLKSGIYMIFVESELGIEKTKFIKS